MEKLNERQYTYPVTIDATMYNERGAIYPAAWQHLITCMMEQHLENIKMDVPHLIRRFNVAWALLEMSVEFRRSVRPTDRLDCLTWHSQSPLPLYRREFLIRDHQEETVAVGTTFSTLLDLNHRRICTDRSILSQFVLPDGEILLDADSRFSCDAVFSEAERRRVRPSWIDGLGHVNNARYGEFVYDILSDDERERIGALKRLDIWFFAELKSGDAFSMQRAVQHNAVLARGVLMPEEKPSFVMKLTF